jgi:GAF domain-containing protein
VIGSLADTVCQRVVEAEQVLALVDIEADTPELATSASDVSSYLGGPVVVERTVYGELCFYDTDPRDGAFLEWDRAIVDVLCNWVGGELEQRLQNGAFTQPQRTGRIR